MNATFKKIALVAVTVVSSMASGDLLHAQSSCSGPSCASENSSNRHANGHRFFHSGRHYGYRSPAYGYGFRPVGYDYRYGRAELLRASATANVLNSQARAINAQTAKVDMENSVQFLATRLERKRINHESRFGHLAERKELARLERMNEAMLVAEAKQVPPVNPNTGRVEWPMLLRTSHYATARKPIESVFHHRSATGRINPDHFLPMRDLIDRIQEELKANLAHYEMDDYLDAQAFLRTLLDEARIDLDRLPSGTQLVAR